MGVYAVGAILLPLALAPATAIASTIRLAFHGWDSAPVGCFEEGSTDTLQLYLPDLLGPVFGPSPYHFGVLSEFGAAFCSGPGGTESDSNCQYDLTLWLEPGNLTIGHVNDRGDQNAALDGEEWLGHRPTDFSTIRVELQQGGSCNTTRTVWIPIEWSLARPDRVAGPIVAWGDNADLQCDVPLPNDGFVAVACGHNQSLGLRGSGSIDAWGANESGQCDVPTPNSGFVAVAGGNWHSLGLRADGSVIAWGENGSGQCDAPTPVGGFVAIEAGSSTA
ncbi:MAG: hypothetical protein IPK72_17860 [Candidatus Eisenbacteria bacterium]|nr:hypothetical protein [Candidatus Eisenbacteria bacterium]